ncbi:HEAT repeat domain-containing protein [Nakamurella sp. GG22]
MSKIGDHRAALRGLDNWLPYLTEYSGLPGPRGNLELVAACGEEADLARALALVATGDEFASVCGVVALGRLFGAGDDGHLELLYGCAADERWRVREGAAMAVQRACDDDPERGFRLAEEWATDPDPLVRRAAVAAVCEPRLLRDRVYAGRALDLLDRITADLGRIPAAQRRNPAVRTLRQALGYGWSVVVAADPDAGLPRFQRLEALQDKDIDWIVRENRKKARFAKAVAAVGEKG